MFFGALLEVGNNFFHHEIGKGTQESGIFILADAKCLDGTIDEPCRDRLGTLRMTFEPLLRAKVFE